MKTPTALTATARRIFSALAFSRFLRKGRDGATVESSIASIARPLAVKSAPAWSKRRWLRLIEASILAVAVCFSLGASDAGARFNNLSHRLMCTCGCAQLLGECNHVGCTESGRERKELAAAIASGLSDQQILNGFVAKYGVTMLAAPPTKGFDLIAWIAPFAVFAAALLGTLLLIRHWGGLGGRPQTAPAELDALDPAEQERIARIRRETSNDAGSRGGF